MVVALEQVFWDLVVHWRRSMRMAYYSMKLALKES